MAVSVLITDRKVYNQYANDNDYSTNLGTYATYLRGGVMGSQKAVYTVEVAFAELWLGDTTGNSWTVENNVLTRNQGSFINEGFSIGDTIDLSLGVPLVSVFTDRIITNITDEKIFFDGTAVTLINSVDGGYLDGGKTDLFGLEYSFGIINNTDQAEYRSLLDNSEQTFYAADIGIDSGGGRDTGFVTLLEKSDYNIGWNGSQIGKSRVRYVSRPSTYIQQFEIEHEYVINPYNNENLLNQNKSFKYVSKFDFRTNLANLNTSKIYEDDLQLGSVGWFNENYDGYNNDFTVSNLVYTDVATASTVTELNIKSRTKIEFTVNSASGYFTNGDPFVVLQSYLPDFSNYDKSDENLRNTWNLITCQNTIGAVAIDNNQAYNVEATFISANEIEVSYEIELTPTFQTKLQEGYDYVLAVEVGNGLLQTYNVTLEVDRNQYAKDSNITDLIISDEFGFNPYYRFIAPTVDLFSTYFGWIEDEIVSYHRFGVNRTALKDAEILGARFKIVAYEDSTGETFDLQNEELDLSGQLIAPIGTVNSNPFTIQLINDDRKRGYNLPSGDEFNLLLFETDLSDATYQYYEWRVGFKMNWQYWIALQGADKIFIDTTDTFNGLNNRASNYSLKEGWSIRANWQFDMKGLDDESNTGETEYNFITDQFSIFDFMEQDGLAGLLNADVLVWDCEIFTFDEFGNDLGGAILNNEETFIKAVFTPDAPYIISDITPYWGEIRIAEENQAGFNNDVLSTSKTYLTNNRIIPLDGDSYADINLVSNTIEVDCRTNISQIKENVNYKLSGRLANVDEPIILQEFIFSTELDISTDTFDPLVTATGGEVVTWTLKNGTDYNINSLSIPSGTILNGDELDGTCQNVVVTFSTNNPANIVGFFAPDDFLCQTIDFSLFTGAESLQMETNNLTFITFGTNDTPIVGIDARFNNLTGVLDLSNYTRLGGEFLLTTNPNLTGVTFPTALNSGYNQFSELDIRGCNLTGVLDLSGLVNIGGAVRFSNNANLTDITFASTLDVLTNNMSLAAPNCNLTGTLNLSSLVKLGAVLDLLANPNLTGITLPVALTGGAVFTKIDLRNCDLTGVIDMSALTNMAGTVRVDTNPNLTGWTLPVSTNQIKILAATNCGLTTINISSLSNFKTTVLSVLFSNNNLAVSDINNILIHLDSVLTVGAGAGSGSITLNGQTPAAAPTGAGITAASSLVTKGYTVTTD